MGTIRLSVWPKGCWEDGERVHSRPGTGHKEVPSYTPASSWPLLSLDRARLQLITATGNNYSGFSAVPGRLIKRDPDPKINQSVVYDSNHTSPDNTPQGLRMAPQKDGSLEEG